MRIKSIASLLLIFMCLFIFTSCGTSPSTINPSNSEPAQTSTEPPTDDISNSDLVNLLIQDNLEVSEDLISQFFWYYRQNRFELSMLPSFVSPEQADWDEFTLFIYLNFAEYGNFAPELTKAEFAETVRKYFGEIDYTDRSSSYLTYADGIYTVNPGDTMRHGYYRLIDISKDTNGIYTATFDGLFFGELEYSDLYKDATPNIKAIRDAAGTTEVMHKTEFEKTVLDIFLKTDYNKILNMTEKVTIQFTLSGDDNFPFVYKSCEITNY